MCSTAVRDVACSSPGRSLLPSQAVASRPLEGGFEWLEMMKNKGEAYAKGHGTAFIGACGRLMIGCMPPRPMRRGTTRWEWTLAGLNATQPLSQPCQRCVAGRSAEGSGAGWQKQNMRIRRQGLCLLSTKTPMMGGRRNSRRPLLNLNMSRSHGWSIPCP